MSYEVSSLYSKSPVTVNCSLSADVCSRWDGKENGIKNADYTGYYKASSSSLERILTMYTPAAAFTVEDDFFAYKSDMQTSRLNFCKFVYACTKKMIFMISFVVDRKSITITSAKNKLSKYFRNGIYNGCESPKRVNHGVIIVGYSPDYWEVKNRS